MASGGAEEDDGGVPLDIDNVHMLLQVEHEQIQKRTFTNWINAQLSKRCPPSFVSDLFSDLRDGSQLLDLLEVMTGQPMKRQRGRGVFQQRANIETALNFLKRKSIKLVNINIPDITDGRPTIILGLIWTIILHCHIEELASTLAYSSCHSSLDSLSSLDSFSSTSVPASPVPTGRTSPLHRRFRISAKKALLIWVRDQCQKVGCSVSVKDFKKSWRSGEAFLAILCSLRPQLVDLSLVQSRSNQENLEEAFHLAERELHIPRLLEPQDVDVKDPEEKSIMTYVAQFLQYSNDMPAPDDHLQVPQSERAREVTCWLQQTYQELLEARAATEKSSFAEKYQVFQRLAGSITEQRKPVMTLLAAVKRCPDLSQEQRALKTAWDHLEEELQRCKADLDLSLPPPLDSVVLWLQRAEAALTEEGGKANDHADAAKDARAQQDKLQALIKEMSCHVNTLDTFENMDESSNLVVPHEKYDEIKRRLTNIRVSAKYQGIKLEYQEYRHTVLDLLGRINEKIQTWKAPYKSQETVRQLLQDWHETVERQGLLLILMDALQNLKEKANAYTSKAALGQDSHLVTRQVKEAESEAGLVSQAVAAVRGKMERVVSAWEVYNSCMISLQMVLEQKMNSSTQDMSEWMSCQGRLNEAGNFLTEVTESSTSLSLAEQLSKVNLQWADCMKRIMFEVSAESSVSPLCLQTVRLLTQEANLILKQPLEVASVSLKANKQKLQLLSKKMVEVDPSSFGPSPDSSHIESLLRSLPKTLAEAERSCGELQRASSRLEGHLAELDRWRSEAMDCYQELKERKQRGCSAVESKAKVLITRGSQLENQVVTEGRDLQELVAQLQKTTPLQHLSTSDMQDRISATVSHSQEILCMFSSLGFQRPVGSASQTQTQPQQGSIVVARTKNVEQIGNVLLPTRKPNQVSPQFLTETPQQQSRSLQDVDKPTIVVPRFHLLPHPSKDPAPQISFPVTQIKKEAQREDMNQPQSFPKSNSEAQQPSQRDQILSAVKQAPVRPRSPVLQENERLSPSQTHNPKSKNRVLMAAPQSEKKPPLPPVLDRSEVHSKAQSMARSRLKKARSHLQGRIQQAIKLFGGKEVSESQAKKKQKALKTLQPAVLEEFLSAVEGLGAFCSESELEDLMLLSDSVKKQWEDVCREMAAFVPVLWSQIREGEQPFNYVQSDVKTNTVHEATDQTDSLLQKQDAMDEAVPVDERVELLEVLCDSLSPKETSSSAIDQLRDGDEAQETQSSDTELHIDGRGRQLRGNTLLRATGTSADTQRSDSLPQKQSADSPKQEPSGVGRAVSEQPCRDLLQPGTQDLPAEREDELKPSGKSLKPALRAKEQQLKARLVNVTGSNQPAQTQIQAVVRGNTVETKQRAEWTVIPETVVPPQEEDFSKEEVPQRMTSQHDSDDLMESTEAQLPLITEKLGRIMRESVDISSLTPTHPVWIFDLKEMDDILHSEIQRLSELQSSSPSTLHQALHTSVDHVKQLRQRLEKVQTAARALDHFLSAAREVKAEIPTLLAEPTPSRQQRDADWEQEEGRCWQELQTAAEQTDSILKSAGMTLSRDGSTVTCQDLVTSLSRETEDAEKQQTRARNREKLQEKEALNPVEINQTSSQEKEQLNLSRTEEESEAKRSRLDKNNEIQREGKIVEKCDGDVSKADRRRRSSQVRREEEEEERLVRRRAALLVALKEIEEAAERLGLQEATLPALQQRTRALKELESRLSVHLTELQQIQEAASPEEISDSSQNKEVEETRKAVSDRLEQCNVLTELLKRFQSVRGELRGTLQRAESTISEQASYMGKDNLQRLHSKVQDTKVELNSLGDKIEEVRSVCRQLHTHLRQIPECNSVPFEDEADALMDRWLDISERTDSHLENLHLSLTLWEGILQLGAEVESWTASKLAVFAQSPSFQTEEDITALQDEIVAQEENMERFHRRAAEIKALLQSSEPPLELQVVETQLRTKIEQLKELLAEAEDVYRQMVAAKGHITDRMAECCNSLQRIQDSLLTLTASDAAAVLAKLKDLLIELQTQEEEAESLLEDLRVISSITSPVSVQSLFEDGVQLQEKIQNTHQLFSEVELQTERSINALDRLQRESGILERWLQTAEAKEAEEADLNVLQEEALQQRMRAEDLHELVSSLQSSSLQQHALVDEAGKLLERHHNFECRILRSSKSMDIETVDSPLGEIVGPEAKTLQPDLTLLSAAAEEEEEARLKEIGVTGNGLSHRQCDKTNLMQQSQDTQQRTEEQLHHSDPQAAVELTSSYLAQRQQVCRSLEDLQRRAAELQTLFPWPGTAERKQICLLAHQLQDEVESLQLTVTRLAAQKTELPKQTADTIWRDSSSAEPEACCSLLMAELKGVCSRLGDGVCKEEQFGHLLQDCQHKLMSLQERFSAFQAQKESSTVPITDAAALEALLQKITDMDEDLVQLATLKDSVAASSTVEATASLSEQVSKLQIHKRALDDSIRENLTLLAESRNQRVQQVKEEVACVQTELENLREILKNVCGSREEPSDMSRLKQQWYTVQDCDARLTELTARVHKLQETREPSIPAEIIQSTEAVAKDLDSLRSNSLQNKQQFVESTAQRVRQAINQLQTWSQTAPADTSPPSQATLDEGLGLQQAVHEFLSDQDFLLNYLGKKAAKKLRKRASDALSESTPSLEALSKHLVQKADQAHSEEETGEDSSNRVVEETKTSSPPLPEETPVACPPVSPSDSATLQEETSETHLENEKTDSFGTPKGDAHPFPCGEDLHTKSASTLNTEPLLSDSFPSLDKSLLAQTEATESLQDDPTSTKDSSANQTPYMTPLVKTQVKKQNSFPLLPPEDLPKHLMAPSEASKAVTDAQKEDTVVPVAPKKVFTIVLEMDPQDIKIRTDTELRSSVDIPEEESTLPTTLDETDLKTPQLHLQSNTDAKGQDSESVSFTPEEVLTAAVKSQSAKFSQTEIPETHEATQDDVLNSSNPSGTLPEGTAVTTFPADRREEMTDICLAGGQTMSSVLLSVDGDLLETHTPASQTTGREHLDTAVSGLELPEFKLSEVPERREETMLVVEERPWIEPGSPESLEDTEGTETQKPQTAGIMESEGTAGGLEADQEDVEAARGSTESCKHRVTMQDILTDVQSLVEKSNIINRAPHIDLNWYLKLSPGEPEIRLIRTVQKVLACRYQPAQLDVTAMAKQLQEAEDFRCCVQEQLASMKSRSSSRSSVPEAFKSVEGQWSAALLDASATVQVKAAQLDQVRQYQKQMKIIRAFLAVVSAELDKMNLETLGSSALQASKLQGLLQTLMLKKGLMEELLQISSQLSVHLSDAESSGVLLAQLGDVQEEWRLLEGSIKRALQHASSSTSQSSLLIKDINQLKSKLEALQTSDFESNDSKSALEFVGLTIDLKLYNQLHLHLKSESETLMLFSLGQKEKYEIKRNLQEVQSLLNVTKSKLDTSSYSSPAKINKQLQDLITWAKQAENHISMGKKLALFPEEARIQITEMKKFQTDVWSRRSKMQAEVEQIKDIISDMEKEESDQVFKTVKDLYEAISDSLDHVLTTMKKSLLEREKMLCQLASMDAWLAETHSKREPSVHVDNVSKANIRDLESELRRHKFAVVKIESSIKLVEDMAERCKEIAVGLSPGESRYIVNRLSGLWTELDGLLALEKATSWELEELIHERSSSDEELSTIKGSLKQMTADLEQQKFPLTHETVSKIALFRHMLMEHQCQVQELQHCQEAKRSSLLCTVGELQDQCKALSINTFEQEKYLHLKRQMEESRDIAKEHIERAKNETMSLGERIRLCQTLLVELPLVKTQCQEAADQLEAIAQELNPTVLNSERESIRSNVDTLVSWEESVTHDIKNLEAELLPELRYCSEQPAFTELLQRTREELEGAKPVKPDEKAIDIALRRCWVIWRNMESGMRVLERLRQKEKINLKSCKELDSLRDATMQTCQERMESLSQARESLKDYQWAAQGAIGFLHNAEATFLSAPGGFLDCTDEQKQTQQALETLEEGFQAHICHLVDLVPKQPCLSRPKMEQLHISILSQLLVGRAVLEAQAQLRLESLQRCEKRQESHRRCHEELRQRLSVLEESLSDCAAEPVTSYDKCVAQQKRAKALMEDLHSLAGKIEELRAGCPMQGCGVGKDGELGALWRRWVSLRRGVGLLRAHAEQRGEEWKDITTSMEQCCNYLASLQAEVPDSSTATFTQEEPQELLAQAEVHQAGLEQEQQALASLEHRLEHALSLSSSQDPASPGPVGKTLVKIQENVRSLKERNQLVVAAAQAEETQRQQVHQEIEEVEQRVFAILSSMETCSNPSTRQELKKDLSTQTDKLRCIRDVVQSRYSELPADISRRLEAVQLALSSEEEKLMEKSVPVQKLNSKILELGSCLEKVKMLLEEKSPTVNEAKNVLKRVWDELDAWHSRLMLLDSEVQDLAEEHPHQAHLLMDQLTHPLQLYQNTAQMAEQRTAFLSRIPGCLQEFEDIVHGATCWLDEAQSWLSAPCSFTTARSLQNHANSLQLVLDDSERIRNTLQDFKPVLDEVSSVCDTSVQEEKLKQNDKQVDIMQSKVLEPLEQLLQAFEVVEETEDELKTMEKNVQKIRAILSSMDNTSIPLTEHLQNRQVILANLQSMQRTLEEMEKCKGELRLPKGAEESLLVFSRARLLLQQLQELEELTQQQTTLLEKQIKEEDLGITAVSDNHKETQQPNRSQFIQEAFEVSNSEEEGEEEEEEENRSCHSSSSDTLTCSIPEVNLRNNHSSGEHVSGHLGTQQFLSNLKDPEETLNAFDVQLEETAERETLPQAQEQESLIDQLNTKADKDTDEFISKVSGSEIIHTDLTTVESKGDLPEALSPEMEGSIVMAADDEVAAASTLNQNGSPIYIKEVLTAAAAEDTKRIPERPETLISEEKTPQEFKEDTDECLATCADLHHDVESVSVLKQQSEVSSSQSGSMDGLQQAEESSEVSISTAGQEEEGTEQQSWSQLYTQISQKLTTLKKVQEEHQALIGSEDRDAHEKVSEKDLMSTGSASAVLQRTHKSINTLRQIVSSAHGSHPGEKKELHDAVRRVLLSLDAVTDLLLTPGGSDEEDPQMRLIQQECVSAELVTVAELLSKAEAQSQPELSIEEPEALRCLTSLQDCLYTVQLVLKSSQDQLNKHLDVTLPQQEPSSIQLSVFEDFELGPNEIFPDMKNAPSLEQCVLGRHLTEGPGEKEELQQASWSLLQGATRLLELGEECITERQMSQVHNRGQLQAILCRHKKLLRGLRSQLAFVQHLFQREPGALRCQEDQRVQLEVRAKSLQQQALDQDVASHRRIQAWTRWEDNCGRLGRVLDDAEAFISSEEPEGEDEKLAEDRLDVCKQTLVQLDEIRAALGLLLDQGKLLQTEPALAATVSHTGGALELRWHSAYRWTEQEIQRCRDIQDSRGRFQLDFASVCDWLVSANKRLKNWSNLAEASDLEQECIYSSLIELLDFSIELESVSVKRASVSRDASQLLQLKEADCPGLRAQLAQLESSWSQTSDLYRTQERLQQRLLSAWPPVQLLCDLDEWLQKQEAKVMQETEKVCKAEDAAQITKILQKCKELKAGLANGQLLLDYLCQSGPQVVGKDVKALRSKRTVFAEDLGGLRLKWQQVQRELETQISEAEQIHHSCADRERRLQRLHGWIEEQKKKLNEWKEPACLALARKALQESEAVVERVKENTAALQKLKATRVCGEKGEDQACDVCFSGQAERVCQACEDLGQQMDSLRPTLQQTVEEWESLNKDLMEVSEHTTRLRCSLQHQRAPVFSLKQAEADVDLLQQLQKKTEQEGKIWASLNKPYEHLLERLHHGTAQAIKDQIGADRKRWKDTLQQLKDEHAEAAETLSLWQEFTGLSDRCSEQLQKLRLQWEETLTSSPEQEKELVVLSVELLQTALEDLQSSVGDVLAASKPLIGRLQPMAANLIQSETRRLSRDVLRLSQGVTRKQKHLQEDLEHEKLFHALLEAVEKQTENIQNELRANCSNIDSVEQVLSELSGLFASLGDVRDMSGYLSLNNNETERVFMLSSRWVESMTQAMDVNRELQVEHQRSQSFQEKCENMRHIQKKLHEGSLSRNLPSSLKEMLNEHQRLEVEVNVGKQLLHDLLCQAVESMEKGEERSELMADVNRIRESWFNTVTLVNQRRTKTKAQVHHWRIYHRGFKLLWKFLKDVDVLLPPAGPTLHSVHQQLSCVDNYQCIKEALELHSSVYTQTIQSGRHFCDTVMESETRTRLQSDLQVLQETWERSNSLLHKRKHLVDTTNQKWSQYQDQISSITSDLDEMKTRLTQPERAQDSEEEKEIQETELSLQHLAGGLRELATMKTDLSQYVAAGDSALLEQQLEQLHGQWEELCMKVSLRRQEIADRLNAWTIFNDKNKEFCDWLTQMENKVCHRGDLSIEEMVEKLKKDCMEEINLFSENKSHLKQLGEQLLLASDEAKQSQVHGSLQEVNQRWHHLFHHIEARVKKLKETLVTVQQLDKNMSNLRSWLSRIEAELSRPITYSVCHHHEIQKRLAEQQELQRDIEQHTEGVASVLSLCDVLLRDEDAAGGTEAESDSLQETSRSLDQRWRTICALALDRRLKIEETWGLWCKFLDDYSRFEDWLRMAERTAANPNSADVLYTVAKEELKKFEGFQRQVHERLTQLELVNNQYRRLARENRTDRASQLKAMVHEGNQRWDTLHHRVGAILRRLKYFTSQRDDFEGTRETMLVWLTELDLQLTNVEHFSESDVHHKIQQLNSFQKEITLNTERIDGLIVFGEGLIQKSSPQDAVLIEDELEELHSYCQEVFSRLVRFHQRLSQPPIIEEPEISNTSFSLESSLELISRPWLGRSLGSFPATPTHLLACAQDRSGRGTPVSVDSLQLEWDHTVDVGGSSSHEDDEDEAEEEEDGRTYFSALSELELLESLEEFVEAREALRASSLASSRSMSVLESPRWRSQAEAETQPFQQDSSCQTEATPTLTSTPLKPGYLHLMSQCSGSIEDIKRVSLILDDEEQPEELGLTGLSASDKQSGVIERWELLKAQSRSDLQADSEQPQPITSDLDDITSWLEGVIPHLDHLQRSELAAASSVEEMAAQAKELKEMQKTFAHYKNIMLSVNLRAQEAPELQERLAGMNRDWSRACTGLQEWDGGLRRTLMRCQEFHESLHSLLLWLAHAESRRYAVDISNPKTPVRALQQHHSTLKDLQEELRGRQAQQASLQALWCQLQPEDEAEESDEAQEKLHVTGSKLKLLLRQVEQDLSAVNERLDCESGSEFQGQSASADSSQDASNSQKASTQREKRDSSPPRSFFYRVLRAAFPLHLLLLFLLLLPCLIPLSESDPTCTTTNNFARSFYPMLRYTNGPPPT